MEDTRHTSRFVPAGADPTPGDAVSAARIGHRAAGPDVEASTPIAGRYLVLKRLSVVAGYACFLVNDTVFDRTGVLRLLTPGFASGKRYQELLERCEAINGLRSPHLAGWFDWGRLPDGSFYQVREHVKTVTLAELIGGGQEVAVEVASRMVKDILAGLEACHQRGVVHGCLSMSNVVVDQSDPTGWTARLVDFAVSTAPGVWRRFAESGSGTCRYPYVAPELADASCADPAGPAADVYMAAGLISTLVAVGGTRSTLVRPGEVSAGRTASRAVPRPLGVLLDRCRKVDPKDRPKDAATLRAELLPLLESRPRASRTAPWTRSTIGAALGRVASAAQHAIPVAIVLAAMLLSAFVILRYNREANDLKAPEQGSAHQAPLLPDPDPLGRLGLGHNADPSASAGNSGKTEAPDTIGPANGVPRSAPAPPARDDAEALLDRELAGLKERAREALDRDRLTVGRGSVVAILERIAALSPDDPFLAETRQRTADRLVELALQSASSGQEDRAGALLERALDLSPEREETLAAIAQFEQGRSERLAPSTAQSAARPEVAAEPLGAPPRPKEGQADAQPAPEDAVQPVARAAAPEEAALPRETARGSNTPPGSDRVGREQGAPAAQVSLSLGFNPLTWPKRIAWPADGSSMQLVPGGSFRQGGNYANNERPVTSVYVDSFYMDVTEVTNREFEQFDPSHERDAASSCDACPVVNVSWEQASAFARSRGKRLPTEAQWERAARGGMNGKAYPWGDEQPSGRAHFAAQSAAPVGSYPPNGYGLQDMSGNVWEWCSDWYSDPPVRRNGERNPEGPGSGDARVLRGGGWDARGGPEAAQRRLITTSVRKGERPQARMHDAGFRCIVSRSELLPYMEPN